MLENIGLINEIQPISKIIHAKLKLYLKFCSILQKLNNCF